jgi:hypothetical protein
MKRAQLTSGLSIFVATLVLLSSLHITQVIGTATAPATDKKLGHDDTAATKLISELHHHSDKSGSQLIKDAGGDHQMYADGRSLRLVHKKDSIRARLTARWLRTLHEMHLIHNA